MTSNNKCNNATTTYQSSKGIWHQIINAIMRQPPQSSKGIWHQIINAIMRQPPQSSKGIWHQIINAIMRQPPQSSKGIWHQIVNNFAPALFGSKWSETRWRRLSAFIIICYKLKGSWKLENIMSYARYPFIPETGQELSEKKKWNRRKLLREIKVTGNVLFIVVPFTTRWTFFIGTYFLLINQSSLR